MDSMYFCSQDYLALKTDADKQLLVYNKLQRLVETPSMISITRDSWRHIQTLWNDFEILVRSFDDLIAKVVLRNVK